jgi:hypothetical protein
MYVDNYNLEILKTQDSSFGMTVLFLSSYLFLDKIQVKLFTGTGKVYLFKF